MNALLKIKNLLFKLKEWEYLFFLATSAFFVTAKGFLLGKILSQSEYALYSFFQLYSGLGCVIAGTGIILRCHVEIPHFLQENNTHDITGFLGKASTILITNSILFVVIFFAYIATTHSSLTIAFLGAWQAVLMLFFTVELIRTKSKGLFTLYAKKLLSRNLAIFVTSIAVSYFARNSVYTAASETLINLILSGNLLIKYFKISARPDIKFIKDTLRFAPLELLGAFTQFQDRIAASCILSKGDFSKFSYFYIIISIGVTLQQFINTKLIVNFSTDSYRAAFRRFTTASMALFFLAFLSTSAAVAMIFFLRISPKWLEVDMQIILMTVLIASLRGADITQGYLASRHMKKFALSLQIIGTLTLIGACFYLYDSKLANISSLLIVIASWQTAILFSGSLVIYNNYRKNFHHENNIQANIQ